MIELEKLSLEGRFLAVNINGNERVVAEVFEIPGGIGFADIGWNDPYSGRHPFHIVEGELKAKDNYTWEITDNIGRLFKFWLMTEDDSDQLFRDRMAWGSVRNKMGKPYDREAARRSIMRMLEE